MFKNVGECIVKVVMNNILKIDNCYGCGVCAASCSKNLIKLRLDRDGFTRRILNM